MTVKCWICGTASAVTLTNTAMQIGNGSPSESLQCLDGTDSQITHVMHELKNKDRRKYATTVGTKAGHFLV